MTNRHIPGIVLSGAEELVIELGGNPSQLALEAGLPVASLQDGDIPVDLAAVLEFMELASHQLHCRNFSMLLAARNGLDVFGPLWILLRSARTLRQMLEDLASNYDMYTRAATISLEEAGETLAMSWDTTTELSVSAALGAEYGFAMSVYEFRKLDPSFVPLAVQFRHAPPIDLSLHKELFGPNLSFNQDRNAIHFSQQALAMPMISANTRVHSLVRSMFRCDTQVGHASLSHRLENMVRSLLPYSPCTVDEVAQSLGVSKRALQDRLKRENTSFKEIRDKVRYDLALKYLHNSSLSLAEISEILGYSELSAFSRSFRRWHGEPASAVRRGRLLAA